MQKRHKYLTKEQVVHLFFYVKIHKRHQIPFECEHALDELVAHMSLQEITIIAMAFARHQQKPKLLATVEHIINKLKQDVPHADEICIRRTVEVSTIICVYLPFYQHFYL